MERELWVRLYHLVMEVGKTVRLTEVTYQPHVIALVFLWAALHDRPVCWACEPRSWSTTTLRPARLPSPATLSRRLRRVDTAMFMRSLVLRVRQEGDPRLVAAIDAKPLPIGGAGKDPEARCGRGAGMWARGYKLYTVWAGRPVPDAYRVYPMNVSENKVAEEMIPELTHGGYLLGDGEYDANPVFEVAGVAGYQLLAPRENPKAGLGHVRQSPYRLRCIAWMRSGFGREVFKLRGMIERGYGTLTAFGCGLSQLPAWVRHQDRVWLWVTAKLLINAERMMINEAKGLAA